LPFVRMMAPIIMAGYVYKFDNSTKLDIAYRNSQRHITDAREYRYPTMEV